MSATALRPMVARYRGTCTACGGSVIPGDAIEHAGRGLTYHAGECAERHDPDARPAPPRARARRGNNLRYAGRSGLAYSSSRYGRCEDAPCCGCCS